MRASRCVSELTEIVVTREEFEALLKLPRERTQAPRHESARTSGSHGSDSDQCLAFSLNAEPSISEDLRPLLRVAIPRFKKVYVRDLESASGKPYPESGLYRNDGSIEPLWTVSWYGSDVFVSDNGYNLARLFSHSTSHDELVVAFYKSGESLAEYRVPNNIWHVVDGLESCHAATAKTLLSPCLSRYLPSRNRACSLGVDTR